MNISTLLSGDYVFCSGSDFVVISDQNYHTYHTLLIALDRYPPGYRSLYGCVNDINALEELLLGEAEVGIPTSTVCAWTSSPKTSTLDL